MKERIQKVLANAGVASRRNVEQMVLDGRVAVNGKIMRELPILIDPNRDKVTVDQEKVKLATRVPGAPSAKEAPLGGPRLYFLLNKPKGVYTTNVSQGVQVRAIDLLPPDLPGRVYPVGQLDAESKGLVMLTNDGELTNRLTHPRYGIAKTYRVIVDGSISPNTISDLERGVWVTDSRTGESSKTGKSQIRIVKRLRERSVLDLTMREGRNREIRRVLAKMGHKVRELTRIKMGPLSLEGLKPGEFRELTGREIKALREATEKPSAKPKATRDTPARTPVAMEDDD